MVPGLSEPAFCMVPSPKSMVRSITELTLIVNVIVTGAPTLMVLVETLIVNPEADGGSVAGEGIGEGAPTDVDELPLQANVTAQRIRMRPRRQVTRVSMALFRISEIVRRCGARLQPCPLGVCLASLNGRVQRTLRRSGSRLVLTVGPVFADSDAGHRGSLRRISGPIEAS